MTVIVQYKRKEIFLASVVYYVLAFCTLTCRLTEKSNNPFQNSLTEGPTNKIYPIISISALHA